MDIPLFHRAISQGEEIVERARPFNVADRLKRRVLCDDLPNGVGCGLLRRGQEPRSSTWTATCSIRTKSQWRSSPAQMARGRTCPRGQHIPCGRRSRAWPHRAAARSRRSDAAGRQGVLSLRVQRRHGRRRVPARRTAFLVNDESFVFPFPDTASIPRYATLQQALDFATGQLTASGAARSRSATARVYPQGGTLDARRRTCPPDARSNYAPRNETRPTLSARRARSLSRRRRQHVRAERPAHRRRRWHGARRVPRLPLSSTFRQRGPTAARTSSRRSPCRHSTLCRAGRSADGTPQFGTAPALVAEAAGATVSAKTSILGAVRASEFVTVKASDSIIDATDPTNVALRRSRRCERRRRR